MSKKIAMTSDIHNFGEYIERLRSDGELSIFPVADVLLIAGDVTGMIRWANITSQLEQFQFLLSNLLKISDRYKYIVGIFGNHDVCWDLDHSINSDFVNEEFNQLISKFNENTKGAKLMWSNKLEEHKLNFDDGELIKILASPYSRKIWATDPWGFHFNDEVISEIDSLTGNDYDILLTHTPIYGYGDKLLRNGERVGTKLFDDLNPKPNIIVCGHIHEDYGIHKGDDIWEGTVHYNVSLCNIDYEPVNEIMVIEVE